MTADIVWLATSGELPEDLRKIAAKVQAEERITPEEGLLLYEQAEVGYLGVLADHVRHRLHGDRTFFNRNFHIEPTNLCVFTCKFCSYSRLLKQEEDGWVLTKQQMMDMVKVYDGKPITEVHIVGGVHPKLNLDFFCDLLREIRSYRPDLHIKAFTAVELEYMIRKAKLTLEEGLLKLKEAGLDSLPGGGAEIFHSDVRKEICDDKASAENWLLIHRTAHQLGIPSNATMLYGHLEKFEHRIHHMDELRRMQDETRGFNTFIPLKYRSQGNAMSDLGEVSVVEDLRNYAIARIYMDNFSHIKAYWPMIGRNTAQISLSFGVDDIDGTIDDSTKIYTMAGAEEQSPTLTTEELVTLIRQAGKHPIERDTLYGVVKDYGAAIAV
ncbi:MAG: aminofutalosine synthase MqnE [Flavobacteriales bacterium]|nr:aminofutalosine synthase MqnE [Flavobacteriales bacterium]MCB9446941.1 aminofutalosine synthase MqnE [Flavobacteriales bacterium]